MYLFYSKAKLSNVLMDSSWKSQKVFKILTSGAGSVSEPITPDDMQTQLNEIDKELRKISAVDNESTPWDQLSLIKAVYSLRSHLGPKEDVSWSTSWYLFEECERAIQQTHSEMHSFAGEMAQAYTVMKDYSLTEHPQSWYDSDLAMSLSLRFSKLFSF